MTAKVFDFASKKKPAEPIAKPAPSTRAVKQLLTTNDIFDDCYQNLIGDWQMAATKNQLSEFIQRKLPKHVRSSNEQADYVSDLNVISAVERRLNMKVAVFYPECTPSNPYGWLAVFHRGREIFMTAPDMATEAAARALNVLLFLALEDQLKRLGRA